MSLIDLMKIKNGPKSYSSGVQNQATFRLKSV